MSSRKRCSLKFTLRLMIVLLMRFPIATDGYTFATSYVCNIDALCASQANYTSVPTNLITNETVVVLLNNNRIANIRSVDFNNSDVISYIELSNNQLTSFPYMPSLRASLKILYLKDNRIYYIDPSNLSILNNLQLLQLDGNRLSSFPDLQLPQLQSLSLARNLFSRIPRLPLLGQTLFAMALSDNLLKFIDVAALYTLKNLAWFYIDSNYLTTFPNFCTMPQFRSITLNMNGNFWFCDCRLLWLKTFSTSIPINALCSSPHHLAGHLFANVDMSSLLCDGIYHTLQKSARKNKILRLKNAELRKKPAARVRAKFRKNKPKNLMFAKKCFLYAGSLAALIGYHGLISHKKYYSLNVTYL